IAEAAGVEPAVPGLHRDVEAVRRFAEDGTTYLFVLNHSEFDQVVQVSAIDLLRGTDADGAHPVPAGAVALIRDRRGRGAERCTPAPGCTWHTGVRRFTREVRR